ncbi:RrF2 family transcriptional regulator [Sphingomonas mali]|uniref:RrF2 family transcriptional regulator n=1 Tax=Sphingomonas mali TaxID=40682 RepID=UPI000833E62A|nr:Rrf2 family transcriptional regulator [Sphingomonas mali]
MAHLTVSVEYGVHSLLWLTYAGDKALSSRDLADLQGISHSYLAKIFPKLEKAGIVRASEGVRGGYMLSRAPEEVSALQIVDAIEGRKPLFDCQDIRGRCAIFGGAPPTWATNGVCAVHAVMLRAEKAMRDALAGQSLADIGRALGDKAPPEFAAETQTWLDTRLSARVGRPGAPSEREVPT